MKIVRDTPLNRLFLAINHYLSTGDHLGEGMSSDLDTHVQIILPVNQTNETDKKDFEAFSSRFDELSEDFSMKLTDHGIQGIFRVFTFDIDLIDVDELAKKLTEQPGDKGWGSMHKIVKKVL